MAPFHPLPKENRTRKKITVRVAKLDSWGMCNRACASWFWTLVHPSLALLHSLSVTLCMVTDKINLYCWCGHRRKDGPLCPAGHGVPRPVPGSNCGGCNRAQGAAGRSLSLSLSLLQLTKKLHYLQHGMAINATTDCQSFCCLGPEQPTGQRQIPESLLRQQPITVEQLNALSWQLHHIMLLGSCSLHFWQEPPAGRTASQHAALCDRILLCSQNAQMTFMPLPSQLYSIPIAEQLGPSSLGVNSSVHQ